MEEKIISESLTKDFRHHLAREERSDSTIEKYVKEILRFAQWMKGLPVTKEAVFRWKEYLLKEKFAPATVNVRLAALNSFFDFCGWQDCRVKSLKLKKKMFRDSSRELSREEYERLLKAARDTGKDNLMLIIETICSTGIRVSEIKYITVESVGDGKAEIFLKGKIRTILIPNKLCHKLRKFAQKNKITSGEIFLSERGRPIDRRTIWAAMKSICHEAGVESSKVFPHNLRHLFARCFYRTCRDISKLADVLGHSCVETTRIYLISTGEEHTRTLEKMRLIL